MQLPNTNLKLALNFILGSHINAIFYMILFYFPNSTQYLNFTTTLLTINNQQIRNLLRENSYNECVPYSKE